MAVFYRKYQCRSTDPKKNGKWYARALPVNYEGIESLADLIQQNTTVKRADVLAVLSELSEAMKRLLEQGSAVRIPYVGSFKMGINTTPAETKEQFTVKNIKNVHVLFQPAYASTAGGKVLTWCKDIELREYNK